MRRRSATPLFFCHLLPRSGRRSNTSPLPLRGRRSNTSPLPLRGRGVGGEGERLSSVVSLLGRYNPLGHVGGLMLVFGIIHLLLNTAAALFGGALLLRVYLSWVRIASHNPLVQFSWALTEWLVKPFRTLLPARTRLDWPCVAAALTVALVFVWLLCVIGLGQGPASSLLVSRQLALVA